MSKVSDTFCLDKTEDEANWICRDAIAQIGWNVQSLESGRIVPKVGAGLTRNPSKLEVLIEGAEDGGTNVRINGSIIGFGAFQKRHLTSEVNRLRNAIEVADRRGINHDPVGN